MIIQWLGVFFAYVILDIVWAKYTLAIARNNKVPAAFWSAIVPVLSALVVIQYVTNPWLLIPMALGGAVGTWIAMST